MPRVVKGWHFPLAGQISIEAIQQMGKEDRRNLHDRSILSSVSEWLVVDKDAALDDTPDGGNQMQCIMPSTPPEEGEVTIRIVQFVTKAETDKFWEAAMSYTAAEVYLQLHVSINPYPFHVWMPIVVAT